MPTENINVTSEVQPQILPENSVTPLEMAASSGKADMIIGAAGALVVMLAIRELVHIGKWTFGKVKKLVADKKVEPTAKKEDTEEK